jgi:hypothetical protein
LPNSASPEMINAGGPVGITIMLNHRKGSSRRSLVYRARRYIVEILILHTHDRHDHQQMRI